MKATELQGHIADSLDRMAQHYWEVAGKCEPGSMARMGAMEKYSVLRSQAHRIRFMVVTDEIPLPDEAR